MLNIPEYLVREAVEKYGRKFMLIYQKKIALDAEEIKKLKAEIEKLQANTETPATAPSGNKEALKFYLKSIQTAYVGAVEVLERFDANEREKYKTALLTIGHTNVISGMPYTTITNKRSEQWKLQLQAHTGKYGIRCYFDGEHIYFLSAMGSAYGRTIGDTFRVTLKCGTVMYVMLSEFKDDGSDPNFFGHTTDEAGNPLLNYDGQRYTCILEFIYDPEKIDERVRGESGSGTFTVFEEFGGLYGDGGDIVKIEYLGRRWKP